MISYKINMFLHQYVYCYFNNLEKIPDGYVIHHKDLNKLNNDISNLELMTNFEHKSLHNINKKHALKNTTEEIIEDIKNRIKLGEFEIKYKLSRGIWDRLRKVYL